MGLVCLYKFCGGHCLATELTKTYEPIPNDRQTRKAVVEMTLSSDPVGHATAWLGSVIKDLGSATELSLKLSSLECQEGLIGKISESASELQKSFGKVKSLLGSGAATDVMGAQLKTILETEGRSACAQYQKYRHIASGHGLNH